MPGVASCYTVAAVTNGGRSAAGASACAETPVTGATFQWDAATGTAGAQDGSGIWNATGSNWVYNAGNRLWYNGNVAAFGVNASTNCTVAIANDVTLAGLTFKATGGGAYTLSGGGGGIVLSGAIPVVASNAATITAALQGSGALVKSGAGTLTLSCSSGDSYTGGTVINGGMIDLPVKVGGGGSGAIRGAATVNTGGTLRFSAGDVSGYSGDSTCLTTLNLNGGTLTVNTTVNMTLGNCTVNMTGGAIAGVAGGNLDFFQGGCSLNTMPAAIPSTISGVPISPLRQGSTTFNVASGTTTNGIDLDISSVIRTSPSGDPAGAQLIKTGAGTMRFNAANTFARDTVIKQGTVRLDGSATLSTGASIILYPGCTLDVTNRTGGLFSLSTNQTLSGFGTVRGGRS